MLKFENVNHNIKKFIKDNYTESELEDELGDYNTYPSEDKLSGQHLVDAPHFLVNHDETKAWFVCHSPKEHVNGVLSEVDIIDFELNNKHKDLKAIAKELDIDYDELKEYHDNLQDDMDAWSELNDLIINSSSTVEMKYGDDETIIILTE